MAFDIDPELDAILQRLLNPQLKEISLGLERIHTLLDALGNPHHHVPPVIHIAGTNGKGSTLAFMRAMLEAAGKRVHLYSSPHLVSFTERIQLAGEPISKQKLIPILQQIESLQEQAPATFFEATTAAAFVAFANHPADVLLLETGLGGRLDATNVLDSPMATVITPIGLDHQDYLGDTIAEIAGEKAGIMHEKLPCFIAEQPRDARDLFKQKSPHCQMAGEDWQWSVQADGQWYLRYGDKQWQLPPPALLGEHQYGNAALAIATLSSVFPDIDAQHIEQGVAQAVWLGRLQPLSLPQFDKDVPVYMDGAHNEMAAKQLVAWSKSLPEKPVLIVAMKSDKDAMGFLKPWKNQVETILFPQCDDPVFAKNTKLLAIAKRLNLPCSDATNLQEATEIAAKMGNPVLFCGSLYLIGLLLR